jgi:outer membrane biosynthesis protein TonB
MTEALPSALEPELRRIIDTAVARVAAIELEAIREARELTQRSEQEAREALKFALDRAFNLINTLELLAATVGGMAEALKIELDDAIDALRSVPEPESDLARELAPAPAAEETSPVPEAPAAEATPAPEPEAAAPAPEPEATVETPTPEPTPAPEPAPEPEPAVPVAATEPEQPPAEEAPPAEHAPTAEQPPGKSSRSNGYSPAERQAQSLAAATAQEHAPAPELEPERTVVRAAASDGDGQPAVPVRRRGLMRRLFAK